MQGLKCNIVFNTIYTNTWKSELQFIKMSSECEQQFLYLCVKTDSERATQNHSIFHFPFLIPLCNMWPKQMPRIYLWCPAAEKALFHYISSSETLLIGEVEVNPSVLVLSWCVRWALPSFCWWTRLKRNQAICLKTSSSLSLIINNVKLLIILLICCWYGDSTRVLWWQGKGMFRWVKPGRVRVQSCWGSTECEHLHL